MSHPAWVCGLKPEGTPYIDAYPESHPAWVCGLKLSMGSVWLASLVTPCVGVWIETLLSCQKGIPDYVTPCVGVWIETVFNC